MGYLEKTSASQTDPDLWQRISQFTLDVEGARFPFSARLARENGWSRQQSQGAIEEYKKFIYLICVSNMPLTPSEAVDQVWHLHLVYTRSYWNDFCDGVLGRPIHHDPTKGGEQQAQRFIEQYARTCALYEREFGNPAPAEHWPPVAERFAASRHLQWIDHRQHWVVRKPGGLREILRWAAAPLLLLLTSTRSLQAEDAEQSSGDALPTLIVFGLFVGLILLFGTLRNEKKDKDTSGCGGVGGGVGCGGGCGGCGGCGG